MKNKFLVLLMSFVFILSTNVMAKSSNNEVKIWLKGDYVKSDVAPVIKDSRTLVPVRLISESLGYEVSWDENERLVTINNENTKIQLKIDSDICKVGDVEKKLNIPAQIINSRTFIPLRDVAEIFGEFVDWEEKTRTVLIGNENEVKLFKENLAKSEVSETKTTSNSSPLETLEKNIQGKNVKACYISPNSNYKFKLAKANDALVGDESFSSIVSRNNAIAAINGNFFDSYNTKVPFGPLVSDGVIFQIESSPAKFIVFEDGSVDITDKDLKLNGYLDGKRENAWNNDTQTMEFNTFTVWYANNKPNDPSGIYLYNHLGGSKVKLNEGVVVEVVNNSVSSVKDSSKGQTFDVPKDGYLIFFGKDNEKSYVTDRFKVSRKVDLELVVEGKDKKIVQTIGAGPFVVENGEVASKERLNAVKEAKISKNRALRSAIGIINDGRVVIARVTNSNMNELGAVMKELGANKAFNLDGQASSALFVKGKINEAPGRKLNNVLVVVEK